MTPTTMPPEVAEELNEVSALFTDLRDKVDPEWLTAHGFESYEQAVDLIGRATGRRGELNVIDRLYRVHGLTTDELTQLVGRGNPRPAILALHLAGVPNRHIIRDLNVVGVRVFDVLKQAGLSGIVEPRAETLSPLNDGAVQLKVAQLFREGLSYTAIGEQMGLKRYEVQRVVARNVKAGLMRQRELDKRKGMFGGDQKSEKAKRERERKLRAR